MGKDQGYPDLEANSSASPKTKFTRAGEHTENAVYGSHSFELVNKKSVQSIRKAKEFQDRKYISD